MESKPDHMSEAAALRAALTLDADELAFLRGAALPARFIALVQAPADPRAQMLGLLWLVLPATIGYTAWLYVAPLFNASLSVMAQSGGNALIISLLTNLAWGTLDSLASLIEALSAVPGFNAPLVTLSLVAVALYAVAVLTPTRTVRQGAAAV